MKKRNFHYFIDTTFYFFVLCVPFFVLIALALKDYSSLSDALSFLNGIFADTELYNSIYSVLSPDGVSPLFNNNLTIFIDFICYVVYVTVLHLIIDCLQFIPQLAHHFLDCFGGKDFE